MELCMSYLTGCGSVFRDPPQFTVAERSYSAFKAGFTSIGMAYGETPTRSSLIVPVTELEWVDLTHPNWDEITGAWWLTDHLGTVERIKAGCALGSDATGYEAANLRTLARMAGDHGIKVVVEPVSWGAFPTVDSVMSLMSDAGGQNMSLVFDAWQVWRSESKFPQVDVSALGSVEISGNDPQFDTYRSNVAGMNRALPNKGDNTAQLTAWLADTLADGYNGPIGVEVPRRPFRQGHCDSHARHAHYSATEVICDAR